MQELLARLERIMAEMASLNKRVARLERREGSGPRLISRTVLTAAAATIDIQDIPQVYRHLELRLYARGDTAATNTAVNLTFNGDTGNNYDRQYLEASAAVVAAGEAFGGAAIGIGVMPAASAGANLFGQNIVDILNYANSTNNKTVTGQRGMKVGTASGNMYIFSFSGFWRSNAAITRATLTPGAGNFGAGTVCEVMGIP